MVPYPPGSTMTADVYLRNITLRQKKCLKLSRSLMYLFGTCSKGSWMLRPMDFSVRLAGALFAASMMPPPPPVITP